MGLVAVGVITAGATGGTTEGTHESAELEDLQFIADKVGISLEEAVDRYGWNDNFADAVADIRAGSPDGFAGASIAGDSSGWVAFSSQTPQRAQNIIDAFASQYPGVSVEVRNDLGYSESQLEDATAAAHYAVFESDGVLDAFSSFDYDTNQLTVLAQSQGSPSDPSVEDLRKAAESGVSEATGTGMLDKITVNVSIVQYSLGSTDSDTHHLGGEDLESCTSGFGTVDSSGTKGISTAGHCADHLSDDDLSLTWRNEHIGDHGDFQWHTGAGVEGHNFYAGNDDETEFFSRPVESVGTPVKDQWLCKNGLTTHKDCQQVRKTSVCKGGVCSLALMKGVETSGGDSGGPVYWGRAAYGLHHGRVFDGFFRRDAWSRADHIDEAMGVNIATD